MRCVARRLLGCALLVFAGMALAQSCESPRVICISLIPKKSSSVFGDEYRPLVKLLESTRHQPVDIVQATSYGSVAEGLLTGTIDLAELGPASYSQAKARDPRITAFASMIQRVGPHTDAGDSYRSLLWPHHVLGLA